MRKIPILIVIVFHLMFFQLAASTVNLVWQTDRLKSWEEDWLMELLKGLDVKVIDDNKYQKFVDNSVIVLSAWHLQGSKQYFKKLNNLGYNFGIILLGDERSLTPLSFHKQGKFVFRCYWNRNFIHLKNVFTFPLGYKTGFWSDSSPLRATLPHRDYTWSFAGQIVRKPTREEMISYMKVFPNYFIHETSTWADPNSLNTSDYRDLLLSSLFVPCPSGWCNLDSFRVYEALECGCIPIVEKSPEDYFSNCFGKHPFLAVDSWDQAPALMKALLDDPVLLEQRRQQCYEWWQNKKRETNKKFLDVIKKSFKL